MTLNDGMTLILRYFTEFVYDVVVIKVHVRYVIPWWVSCLFYVVPWIVNSSDEVAGKKEIYFMDHAAYSMSHSIYHLRPWFHVRIKLF